MGVNTHQLEQFIGFQFMMTTTTKTSRRSRRRRSNKDRNEDENEKEKKMIKTAKKRKKCVGRCWGEIGVDSGDINTIKVEVKHYETVGSRY